MLDALDGDDVDNSPRHYLGYSQIGEKCVRFLQYYHRRAYTAKISRRIRRLFDFGHIMEQVFYADFDRIGISVQRVQEEIVGYMGHWKGHIDGTGIGVPGAEKTVHLLECKTHNDASFQRLIKAGDVAISHPGHLHQATSYMGHLNLTRTLYLAYNKDDSSYWPQRISFDKDLFEELEFKSRFVVNNEHLAQRLGPGKETWHECRFCDAKSICYGKEQINRNCRTCVHVEVHPKGTWKCGHPSLKVAMTRNWKEQIEACNKYELDEGLS